jgi:D-sedoheptulose 7-phosphate isomerase
LGNLKDQADYELIIPAQTSDRTQEVHVTILHIIIEGVKRAIFPENY